MARGSPLLGASRPAQESNCLRRIRSPECSVASASPPVERVHYILEQAVEQLKEFRQLILVGAQAPVAYFAAPGKNAVLTSPECKIHTLASPGEDGAGALDALASALSLRGTQPHADKLGR